MLVNPGVTPGYYIISGSFFKIAQGGGPTDVGSFGFRLFSINRSALCHSATAPTGALTSNNFISLNYVFSLPPCLKDRKVFDIDPESSCSSSLNGNQ